MNEYLKKIDRFMEKMEPNSIACLFPAPQKVRNRDVHYLYRQYSDLIYLTGFHEPGLIWVFETGLQKKGGGFSKTIHLFMEKFNPTKARWEGDMLIADEVKKRLLGLTSQGLAAPAPKVGSVSRGQSKEIIGDELPKIALKTHEHENPYAAFRQTIFKKVIKNKDSLYLSFDAIADVDNGGYNGGGVDLKEFIRAIAAAKKEARAGSSPPAAIYDTGEILHEMRIFKSPSELQKIKEAISISAAAFTETMKFCSASLNDAPNIKNAKNAKTKEGAPLFEYELKSKLEGVFGANGAPRTAYPSIVGAGSNATVLHYQKEGSQVKPGDLVLIDAGCEWMGYAADITRTFPANGRFTKPQKTIYELVLAAQKAAFEKCRPGSTLEEIHDATVRSLSEGLWELGLFKKVPPYPAPASLSGQKTGKKKTSRPPLLSPKSVDEVIEKKLYRHYYMHFTSHFLGLDVHDPGKYYPEGKARELAPGMVFTVEPGLYFAAENDFIDPLYRGIGIRIEDDICINETGYTNLSQQVPKEVGEIEELMK